MGTKARIRQYVECLVTAALIALFVRSFAVATYTIPSSSMEPTLLVGDYLLANRLSYVMRLPFADTVLLRLGEPKRGDIIIFRYPLDRSKDFVKRMIAKEGDTVEIRNKVVYVNGRRVDDGSARFSDPNVLPDVDSPRDNLGPIIVPKGSYFAMGDNRDNSNDSRFWGFVKEEDLIGKAEVIYFSRDGASGSPLRYVRWERFGRFLK